ncbi:hypothetical protein [Aliarcobacter butzleri]|uniref:hypothetical protein n=1 Tax=Aliarcobacter butzleri TaxID=28197 RepID=UPI0021B203CF|nr:hypothetical protein [Aliarcobacter butzleri]MCT7596078.1 hypothetical protein [Aliarcobacter butzleri]MCT7632111.1 hypothetical protein [Aliarcobacter butzleri]
MKNIKIVDLVMLMLVVVCAFIVFNKDQKIDQNISYEIRNDIRNIVYLLNTIKVNDNKNFEEIIINEVKNEKAMENGFLKTTLTENRMIPLSVNNELSLKALSKDCYKLSIKNTNVEEILTFNSCSSIFKNNFN